MTETEVFDTDYLDRLPPEWSEDLLPGIRERIAGSGCKVVILDDDPTGTQTVKYIPVLTHWSVEALIEELLTPYPAFFILTNSRSMTSPDACRRGIEIGGNLRQAAAKSGVRLLVLSRSDSTLRGHFPDEVDAVAEAMGTTGLPYLIVPFFLEGGRFTVDDIHYVQEKDKLVPAALTPFAKDAAFGFHHSNLKRWVAEKTGGRVTVDMVVSVTLDDIRHGGPQRVRDILASVPGGAACIVNAVSYRDMEVVVSGLLEFEREGGEFLYRTAASMVRTRLGMAADGKLLERNDLVERNVNGGLFIIGSYVPKTSIQVGELITGSDILPLEVQVEKLLDEEQRNDEIWRVVRSAESSLGDGHDVVIFTSRELVKGTDSEASLAIGNIVSESLIKIVQDIPLQPKFLVAKGGITSSDVATRGLHVRRAMVQGQILPGVPVWKLGEETRFPGMKYVVFPGNVGDNDALVRVKDKLQ